MPVLFIVFALTLTACSSQESITAPVQPHPQAAKSGEAALSEGSVETDRAALVAFYVAITSHRSGWDNWLCEAPLDQWAGVVGQPQQSCNTLTSETTNCAARYRLSWGNSTAYNTLTSS